MDEEDFRALIELVAEELTLSGAADLADERHYTVTDLETGETKLSDPPKRLVEMLSAFERYIAIQDRTVAEASLARILGAVRNEGPTRVVVELADDRGPREINLAEAPDLAEVRHDINHIINRLMEDGFGYGDDT
ncbi:hypothetical protein [Aureimonas phyllosphaerae]|uniref:Uncharacterized protein n=1 Tax=Aureimonas phyllosphaerae TaxID=1166078 RepID=A0A7W6BTZ6_9HYPH|nr:hypothetical protein [Aureimonas phyllosphaerae]MBB3937988.1 hypothetical protein [Aureimonas phyllosphaerae]MBB3961967.1 hypothetical protein [Aureimonas phyllosphaerae]SFF52897.1 hypothetical protein SAMN05216566_12234 [Aureimonas phyllosphaerae]